jgi:superfamily II DNA helicase RecQ
MKHTTRNVAFFLEQNHFKAKYYSSDLPQKRRLEIQADFMNEKIQIMVATVAFGMGIDKPNVEAVVHYNIPRTMESYLQEIGRAGRNGC